MITKGNHQVDYLSEIAGYVQDTGAANAYVVTIDPAITTLTAGLRIKFKAANSSTGPSTINVNGIGAVPILKNVTSPLDEKDIREDQVIEVIYDGSIFQWIAGTLGSITRTEQFALYQDAADNSAYIPSYEVAEVAATVYPDQWWDGPRLAYVGKRIFLLGGWYDPGVPVTQDRIMYSDDNGATWDEWPYTLPYASHTFMVIHTQDGWWYLLGGDMFNTATERKTVHRTRDFINFELRTNNAAWGNSGSGGGDRVLAAAVELANGVLAVMGGQDPNDFDTAYNDIWISEDYGSTWSLLANNINVAGDYFLGRNIVGTVVRRGDKIYQIGGGKYHGNPVERTYSAKCYVTSIFDPRTWVAIDDMPFGARSYHMVAVWDGQVWASGGVNDTGLNQTGLAFLDKDHIWHDYETATRASYGGIVTATHAAGFLGVNGRLLRAAGNGQNTAFAITRSVNLYPESEHKIYNDTGIGELGSTFKFGINVAPAQMAAGAVLETRGKGIIQTDAFVGLFVRTDSVSNNATAIGVTGGGTPYYMFGGGSSGPLANMWGIYQDGSNFLPINIIRPDGRI